MCERTREVVGASLAEYLAARVGQDDGRVRPANRFERGRYGLGAQDHARSPAVRVIVNGLVAAQTPLPEILDAHRGQSPGLDAARNALGERPGEHAGKQRQNVDLQGSTFDVWLGRSVAGRGGSGRLVQLPGHSVPSRVSMPSTAASPASGSSSGSSVKPSASTSTTISPRDRREDAHHRSNQWDVELAGRTADQSDFGTPGPIQIDDFTETVACGIDHRAADDLVPVELAPRQLLAGSHHDFQVDVAQLLGRRPVGNLGEAHPPADLVLVRFDDREGGVRSLDEQRTTDREPFGGAVGQRFHPDRALESVEAADAADYEPLADAHDAGRLPTLTALGCPLFT